MWTLLVVALIVLAFVAGAWTRTRSSKSELEAADTLNKATNRSLRALALIVRTMDSSQVARAMSRARLKSLSSQVETLEDTLRNQVMPEIEQRRAARRIARPVEKVQMPTIGDQPRGVWTDPDPEGDREEAQKIVLPRGVVRGPGRPS